MQNLHVAEVHDAQGFEKAEASRMIIDKRPATAVLTWLFEAVQRIVSRRESWLSVNENSRTPGFRDRQHSQ
jgi:hypothetical protein